MAVKTVHDTQRTAAKEYGEVNIGVSFGYKLRYFDHTRHSISPYPFNRWRQCRDEAPIRGGGHKTRFKSSHLIEWFESD
jgi:hypothetical protein